MNDAVTLVPTKPDAEIAADLKKRLEPHFEAIGVLMDEARGKGPEHHVGRNGGARPDEQARRSKPRRVQISCVKMHRSSLRCRVLVSMTKPVMATGPLVIVSSWWSAPSLRQLIWRVLDNQATIISLVKRPKPTNIALALPAIFRKGKLMSNLEVKSDTTELITILTKDAGGDIVPAPAGDTYTATSSLPASLQADITTDANGHPAVKLTPLVQASPGISVTVADSGGLAPFVQVVDVVKDLTPSNVALDIGAAVITPQPTPTNPGP